MIYLYRYAEGYSRGQPLFRFGSMKYRFVDLIVKLQNFTKQKIAPADFKEVRTVGDVVNKVYELVKK